MTLPCSLCQGDTQWNIPSRAGRGVLWMPGSLSCCFLNHIFRHLIPRGCDQHSEREHLEAMWPTDCKPTEKPRSPPMCSVLENGRVAARDGAWWCNPERRPLLRGQRKALCSPLCSLSRPSFSQLLLFFSSESATSSRSCSRVRFITQLTLNAFFSQGSSHTHAFPSLLPPPSPHLGWKPLLQPGTQPRLALPM